MFCWLVSGCFRGFGQSVLGGSDRVFEGVLIECYRGVGWGFSGVADRVFIEVRSAACQPLQAPLRETPTHRYCYNTQPAAVRSLQQYAAGRSTLR